MVFYQDDHNRDAEMKSDLESIWNVAPRKLADGVDVRFEQE